MHPDRASQRQESGAQTGAFFETVAAEAESAAEPGPATEALPEEPAVSRDLVMIVDALGITWTTFQLYPHPANTSAWERAMELFGTSKAYPSSIEVGIGAFVTEGGEIEATAEGVARIVRALFLHEVEALSLAAPPTAPDLVRLFEVLHREPTDVERSGGVRALLNLSGVSSIEAVSRAHLEESDDPIETSRHADVIEVVDFGMEPQDLAKRILDEVSRDVDAVTERFTMWYETVLGQVETDDFMAREAVVTTFAEAFFHFDAEYRLAILEYCLGTRTKPAFQILLDQFSGHELATISGDLTQESRSELHEYARSSTDEGRPDELLGMLQSSGEVDDARRAVAGRIAELLDVDATEVGGGATFARLRAELAAVPPASGMGRSVLRDMLAIEDRDGRFRRLLRIWTGKVARGIHQSDLEEAGAWLDAALDHPTYPTERQSQVDDALKSMAVDDLITALVGHLEDGVFPPIAVRLFEAWGPRVTGRLVEQLAEEEDPPRRRAIIDVVATISSGDASQLAAYLSDSRWYVVRNVVMALGKTGRQEVAPRLRNLTHSHADHRVRVEALRSLMPISARQGLAAAIKALRDDHKRVRQAASALLAAADGDKADEALIEALNSKDLSSAVKLRVTEVLGTRGTPAAKSALHAAANKRALIGSGRTLRRAAKDALKGDA